MRDWPYGNGEMAQRIRAHDWAATPLGPREQWPQSLKTAVDLMLGSGHAMHLAWGPQRTLLYNDAYGPMLGGRHPCALGMAFMDAWPEIWPDIEPLVAQVFAGETVTFDSMPLLMTRHGYAEDTWWTFSYSPVRDESGAVAGLLNVTVDATLRVRAERARDEADARLRTVLEGIGEPFYALDRECRFLFASRRALIGWRKDAKEVLGRTFLEVFPEAAGSDAYEAHRRVMESGAARTMETISPILGGWVELDLAPTAQGGLSVAFRDIAARKQAEQRQAFLLKLSDVLRPLTDTHDIRLAAATVLGQQLRASRVAYAEDAGDGATYVVAHNYVDNVPDLAGRYRYSDYGPNILAELEAGKNRVQPDLRRDPTLSEAQRQALADLGIVASLNVPLVKAGRLAAFLGINYATPHDFTQSEIDLVEEVAERTWAAVERARAEAALRESERRLAQELTAARTLQQVSTELISEAEPRALYAKLVDAAMALMRADAGSIQMLERDGSLRLLACSNFDPRSELHWQRVGARCTSACGVALHRNERIILSDVETVDASTPDLEAYRWSRLRAVQSTPLVARDGRTVGMLSTHWRHTHEPSVNELALFDVLAREAADLIDRMQAQTAVRERADWLKGQGEALRAAVNGAPLRTSLGALVRTAIETLGDGVRAAFYVAGDDGTTLHHLVGMSDDYASAVDGVAMGPESLACGLAAHEGQPVLTVDVQTDARWEPWRWLAERFAYRGCWSFPVRSAAGTLVGTLALYWPEPREAGARELELAFLLTNTATIIMSRHRESEVRQQAEDALRAALADREALLRELHHRVKNNLQVITSLLEMQTRQVSDSLAASRLTEARNRVGAIGTIHELLYQSGSLSRVDMVRYTQRLLPQVVSLYARSATVRASVRGDAVMVDLARAVPLGLLLNELISNSCKHAFPMDGVGELTVALQEDEGQMHLRVTDTGVGLPEGFRARESKTLGLQLVQMLARQLGGTVSFRSTGGTTVDVRLPS